MSSQTDRTVYLIIFYLPAQCRTYTIWDLQQKCPFVKCLCGEMDCGPEHQAKAQGRTHPVPGMEIKISVPAGNGTRATRLKGQGLYRSGHGEGHLCIHSLRYTRTEFC